MEGALSAGRAEYHRATVSYTACRVSVTECAGLAASRLVHQLHLTLQISCPARSARCVSGTLVRMHACAQPHTCACTARAPCLRHTCLRAPQGAHFMDARDSISIGKLPCTDMVRPTMRSVPGEESTLTQARVRSRRVHAPSDDTSMKSSEMPNLEAGAPRSRSQLLRARPRGNWQPRLARHVPRHSRTPARRHTHYESRLHRHICRTKYVINGLARVRARQVCTATQTRIHACATTHTSQTCAKTPSSDCV